MVISAQSANAATSILPGQSFPLGATVLDGGVNFCLFSRDCTGIDLLLFDQSDAPLPSQVISLDSRRNKSSHYWHVFVPGISAGQVYAYRGYGLFEPELGLRCDGEKVLLDPFARAVVNCENYSRQAASLPGDNCSKALRGIVVDSTAYDWEEDTHPKIPYSNTIIYELHVASFTRHPNSGVAIEKRGTYAGLIEKIPYLQSLGITAVELMPIHQFDEYDARPGLKNFWGYSTIAFFAPHSSYSSRRDPMGPVDEFRDLVKALHRAGIEVILDVVFNHTAEGSGQGPTLSFRGLSNQDYYMLEDDLAIYRNYSGCGNTFETSAIASHLILESLRYWVSEMHVDGFRFDLASALSRDSSGVPHKYPPLLWAIDSDPVLASTKIIAEAWDAAGLYQVGSFAGDRFAEWNGPYRDDVRRFVKSDAGVVKTVASRIIASPDIYQQPNRNANHSINFITCHDGFTLNDLVAYNDKHNQANGENNCDGTNANYSWNCGVEGATNNLDIETLRLRQIKNFLTILFTSQGTPMLLMGDEVRRTQLGNNNAYCQDSEISWFDWDCVNQQAGLLRFVKGLISFIQSLQIFQQERILATNYAPDKPHIVWHGTKLGQPDWSEESHLLAFTLLHPEQGEHLHIILNTDWEPLLCELPPPLKGETWHRIVDTSLPSPADFCEPKTAPRISGGFYQAAARSAVVLIALA
jgi:isoamylase